MGVVLGIDPGSRVAGYGVVETLPSGEIQHLDHGVISLENRSDFPSRLNQLSVELERLFQQHRPELVVVEDIFVGKNVQSAFRLGHVRGVCLQLSARYGCTVKEYAARRVKKVVTGQGNAEKDHVRLVVLNLLGIRSQKLNDATDALAMAICHIREQESQDLIARQMERF